MKKKIKEKKSRSDRWRRRWKWWRKQKRSGCGIGGRKQESRKWEIKENEIRRGFGKMIKEFGKRFLKQDKKKEENYERKLMATNY